MSNDDYEERPFRGTHYEYKVSLGVVMDEDALSWESHVYCKEWVDVETLVDAWRDAKTFPVVQVDTAFRPKRNHPMAE